MRLFWFSVVCLCAGLAGQPVTGVAADAAPQIQSAEGHRFLAVGGKRILELGVPWLATADWKPVRTFPLEAPFQEETIDGGRRLTRTDHGAHGRWSETVTVQGDSLSLRYDFEFADLPEAAHLQWYWRLEPEVFEGAMVEADIGRPVPLRPLAGVSFESVRQLDLVLADTDLSLTAAASTAAWELHDARGQDWARCYRFEYNRPVTADGARSGWFEVTIRGRPVTCDWHALTDGPPVVVRGIPLHPGQPLPAVDRPVAAILLWHTSTGSGPAGTAAGEVVAEFADGSHQQRALCWEQALTDPADDPRDLADGVLTPLPDGTPAWLTLWVPPRCDAALRSVRAKSSGPDGWRLLAAAGLPQLVSQRRLAAIQQSLRPGPLGEETVISLDGTWQIQAEKLPARDIAVPAFWESVQELRGAHQAVCSRAFDVPQACQGQQLALHFDAVGDYAEVRVNGQFAGQHLGPLLPFEIDITGLVAAPSTGNRLEVLIRDDTFFSVPRPSSDWRNRRHWLPRGTGTNNRKGLYQSVSLRARPPVHIADVRVQTSVSNKRLTAICELFNSGRQTVRVRLGGSVRPLPSGASLLTLPERVVELPGFVTTTVELGAEFQPPGVTLWQPDHPALYNLRLLLLDDSGRQRLQRCDTRFGFREARFEGIHFYLNGIRCNLRGESPAYSEKQAMMSTRDGAMRMVQRYQAANYNVLRFHSCPAPPHVLDVCDELGMLVIDESAIYASWLMLMPEHPQFMPACREHLARWVRRDRNHPAVVLWSAENEGLNVSHLSPAQLAEFRRVIDEHDGTRPVIFDGDGSGYGASPASVKHYVSTLDDLRDRGGRSSGYARDLRSDIYWATEYKQDLPLGCGEFLFPYVPRLREQEREAVYAMGLQTRGYRLADWFDIRPYNPSYGGFLRDEGTKPGFEEAYDILVKSFAPVAVFDKDYDALGPFPVPPVLRRGQTVGRTLIVYNDAFSGEEVTVAWRAVEADRAVAGEEKTLRIPLGDHALFDINFTPPASGKLQLELAAKKNGQTLFTDTRSFTVE